MAIFIWYSSTFLVGTFVREADGSRILKEFQKNSKVIWFLLSELMRNYDKTFFEEFLE